MVEEEGSPSNISEAREVSANVKNSAAEVPWLTEVVLNYESTEVNCAVVIEGEKSILQSLWRKTVIRSLVVT